MAIKSSGNPLSFSEIEAEFGQNNDRDLGEYRVSQTVGALSNQPIRYWYTTICCCWF